MFLLRLSLVDVNVWVNVYPSSVATIEHTPCQSSEPDCREHIKTCGKRAPCGLLAAADSNRFNLAEGEERLRSVSP
jgi:hypothetical protein